MLTINKNQKHVIHDLEKIPNRPHFVVMVYDTVTKSSDLGESSFQAITYFAFETEADWRTMIQEFTLEQINSTGYKSKIAFFHSGGAAKVELKVLVAMG